MIIYRRGRSIGDHLVHSFYQSTSQPSHWLSHPFKGTFKCGSCIACSSILKGNKFVSIHTSHWIRTFINCKSLGLVYLATCACGVQYVGKTTREFRSPIGEHLNDIRNDADTPIARHIEESHDGQLGLIKFQGIELVPPSPRGGNLDKPLLQKEARWIFRLGTVQPNGLNDHICFACFL